MSPTGRRIAAAAAAVTCLLGLAASARPGFGAVFGASRRIAVPAAAAGQETTIDLSSVASAPDYRTDEPEGPGFVGSDAAVLDRSLARINKDLRTSLRRDNRLAMLARWVYERLGPDNAMPPQIAFDVLTHRLGLAEPLPFLLVSQTPDAPRLADVVSARLATVFDLAGYTHIGGMAEREADGLVVVIALSRRHIRMGPVPRSLPAPGPIRLDGRLWGGYTGPELAHTLPGGATRIEVLGRGPDFAATVDLAEIGRHRLEITAQGPNGPDVIANFPVFVGVPVDALVETSSAPLRAERPDEARQRLYELINAERVKAGLDALAFDPQLAEVALKHSEDMSTNGFVSHVSPTSGSTEDRLLGAGIVTDLAAENVGKGYSPDEIHEGFMDSPAHRAAILLPSVTHVGIGVAPKKEYDRTTYLVTELFVRRTPPLGPGAKAAFLRELNRLRESAGAPALGEDPALTKIADETARAFLANEELSQDDVMRLLQERLARSVMNARSALAVLSVGGSLEERARQAASDPKGNQSRRVGIGIAQGTRSDLAPNSIVLVLIYVE